MEDIRECVRDVGCSGAEYPRSFPAWGRGADCDFNDRNADRRSVGYEVIAQMAPGEKRQVGSALHSSNRRPARGSTGQALKSGP